MSMLKTSFTKPSVKQLYQESPSIREREEEKFGIPEDAEGEENVFAFPQEPSSARLRNTHESDGSRQKGF